MKILAILITLISLSFTSLAQRIALSKSLDLKTPENMRRVSESGIQSLATQRYNGTKYLRRLIKQNPGKVFIGDDIVVLINSASVTKDTGTLKGLKMTSDDISQEIKGYSSKIESISGREVFVIDQIYEGFKTYFFTTLNDSGDIMVTGFLQYKPGSELKARDVLADLIKGLSFH